MTPSLSHPPRFRAALLAAMVACAASGVRAETLTGRVVRVKDGDSLVVLVGRRQIEVRLAEVDAPESGQPWGQRAKQALSALVFGRTVEVGVTDHDRYGRSVALVRVDGRDVSSEMVRSGSAWVYRQYAKREDLYDLENAAREARLGLWGLPEADRTPPWEWRHAGRGRAQVGVPPEAATPAPPLRLVPGPAMGLRDPVSPSATGFACGTKRYCREMTSCAEARFHLVECGLARLDGDGDGRPCETLCTR